MRSAKERSNHSFGYVLATLRERRFGACVSSIRAKGKHCRFKIYRLPSERVCASQAIYLFSKGRRGHHALCEHQIPPPTGRLRTASLSPVQPTWASHLHLHARSLVCEPNCPAACTAVPTKADRLGLRLMMGRRSRRVRRHVRNNTTTLPENARPPYASWTASIQTSQGAIRTKSLRGVPAAELHHAINASKASWIGSRSHKAQTGTDGNNSRTCSM